MPSLLVTDGSGSFHTINTLPNLGQANSAGSQGVVIASDQSNIPVSVQNFPSAQTVNGTIAFSNTGIGINNFPATQTGVALSGVSLTSGSLNVFVINPSAGGGATSNVNVQNFPAIQNISGSVTVTNEYTGIGSQNINGSITFLNTGIGISGVNIISGALSVYDNNLIAANASLSTISINTTNVATTTLQTTGNAFLSTLSSAIDSTPSIQVSTFSNLVTVTPTVTAATYAVNKCVGGILTLANALRAGKNTGILNSIQLNFNTTAPTQGFVITFFSANPTSSTFTDNTVAAINAADVGKVLGQITVAGASNTLGTSTIYTISGIGLNVTGNSGTIYVVIQCLGSSVFAATSTFTNAIFGFLQD